MAAPQTIAAGSYAALTQHAVDFIRSQVRDGEVLVVAPFKGAADEIARKACDRALGGVHRATLPQLAASLGASHMADRGVATMGRLAAEALAARVTDLALSNGKLHYYAPVARTAGFPAALRRTIEELRLEIVLPETLEERGKHDLAVLLRLWASELAERGLADLADLLAVACICQVPRRALLLFDSPGRTRREQQLVDALVNSSAKTLMLSLDGADLGRQESCRLHSLQAHLFDAASPDARPRDDSFEMFSASGDGLECVEIARRILASGYPFDDIAVLLRNPERYLPSVEEALRRVRIPGYYTAGVLRPNAAGRAFLALLHCAQEKLSASRFAEYLSLGQTPSGGDAPVRAPAAWEQLLTEAAVIGGRDRWERRLKGLAKEFRLKLDAAEEEAERDHFDRQISLVASLEEYALPLISRLDSLPQSGTWGDWLDVLAELAGAALRSPDPVLHVLQELRPMADVGPIDLDAAISVLEAELRFRRQDTSERRYGKVYVASIEEARGMNFALVFVPGLSEGSFPRPLAEDPLLVDEARAGLGLETNVQRGERERLLLRTAGACARDRLILSWPRMDLLSARKRVPSFYAFEAARAAWGSGIDVRSLETDAGAGVETRAGWPAPRDPAVALDNAEFDLAMLRPAFDHPQQNEGAGAYLTKVDATLYRSLRSRGRRWLPGWFDADGIADADMDTLHALDPFRLRQRAYSVSALQQYAVCPYRFFLRAIQGLYPADRPRAVERIEPVVRGEIFHRAQFELLGELRSAGMLPLTPANWEEAAHKCGEVLERVAAAFEESLAPALPAVWRAGLREILSDLRGWLYQVAFAEAGWTPVNSELSFGIRERSGHDAASSPDEIVVLDGVRLKGSIDLVERHDRGMFRVTDHKTGKPPEKAPEAVGNGEVLQPLLYALAAEKLLDTPVAAARLFYATQREGYRRFEFSASQMARKRMEQVLHTIDDSINNGFLPAAPRKDACKDCDYQPVCGPYEEERVQKKRQNELRPLLDIRKLL